MDNDDFFDKQKSWAEQSLFLMRELLPLMSPVAKYDSWSNEERETLGCILSATARSTESALLLCAYGQLWDAEVLVRSVLEGTLKFIYLLQNQENFKQRYEQYSIDLFKIGLLNDHQKAKDLLEALPNSNTTEWRPIHDRLLTAEEQAAIKSRYGQAERRALQTQWGFTGLIGALSRSGEARYLSIACLTHGYSIASHIQHADIMGVSIPMDRGFRSVERRDTAHLAHLARLIADVFTLFYLRLAAGYRYIAHDSAPISNAVEKIDALRASFGDPYSNWMDTEYK